MDSSANSLSIAASRWFPRCGPKKSRMVHLGRFGGQQSFQQVWPLVRIDRQQRQAGFQLLVGMVVGAGFSISSPQKRIEPPPIARHPRDDFGDAAEVGVQHLLAEGRGLHAAIRFVEDSACQEEGDQHGRRGWHAASGRPASWCAEGRSRPGGWSAGESPGTGPARVIADFRGGHSRRRPGRPAAARPGRGGSPSACGSASRAATGTR